VDTVDLLADLHSMHEASAPLIAAGIEREVDVSADPYCPEGRTKSVQARVEDERQMRGACRPV
jgi:elongation factor P hydroxylase